MSNGGLQLRVVSEQLCSRARSPDSCSSSTAISAAALGEMVGRARDRSAREHGKSDSREAIEWRAANRLYGQKGYGFRKPFLAALKQGYASPLEIADFRGHAEQARGQSDRIRDEPAGAEHDRRSRPGDGGDGLDDPQRDAERVGDVAGEVARVTRTT